MDYRELVKVLWSDVLITERPTGGTIKIDGVDLTMLNEKQLEKRKGNSMIFQSFNLLNQKNCLDNVCPINNF